MPAYLFANLNVTDPASFGKYRDLVAPIVAAFGGRYLVRGGAVTDVEGAPGLKRVVLLEFPSMEALKAFYFGAEYAPVKAIREAASSGDVALLEGFAA